MTTMTTPHPVLNVSATVALAEIVGIASSCARVARIEYGRTCFATARAIVANDQGHAVRESDDIRDCFLWVVTTYGNDAFWPISALIDDLGAGLFARTDWAKEVD